MLGCTISSHSYPTPIPLLSTWTNNVVKNIGSHYTLSIISYIIGPRRQGWDRSGMRVYNQTFFFFLFLYQISYDLYHYISRNFVIDIPPFFKIQFPINFINCYISPKSWHALSISTVFYLRVNNTYKHTLFDTYREGLRVVYHIM
jgi:hypothetical protein